MLDDLDLCTSEISRKGVYMASSGLLTTLMPMLFALPMICVQQALMDMSLFSSAFNCMKVP